MDNQPSFAERIAALKVAGETVMAEVQRMDAAAERFAARRTKPVVKKESRR